MSPLPIVLISDLVTFVLSMLVTLFIAGIRWGEIRKDVSQLKIDVAEIKGMFRLSLRDEFRRLGASMSTPTIGDLPDWSVMVNPNIQSFSSVDQGAGQTVTLVQSLSPYRIWGVWIDLSAFTSSSYALGANTWGCRIGDGSGKALFKVTAFFGAANQVISKGMSLPINGYTPIFSSGFFTTNLITDAGFANMFTRANGGILISAP